MSDAIRLVQAMAGAEHGGAENFFERLVAGFAAREGFSQKVFTRDYPGRSARLRAAGVDLGFFRFGGKLDLAGHWRYRRALRAAQPEVVMTWMNRASILTPPGDYQLGCRLGHYYDLKYYRHADFWVGNTRGICDHLVRGGMPASRVEFIANFVDEQDYQPVPRSELGVPEGVPLLLAAGRLHRNKGFDVLLDALARVPDAVLCIAGVGPEEAALKAQCEQLGLHERVRFLGWRDDVNALMLSADQFVCSSRHEGLGNIVLEAWFRNCPIVAARSQGPEELIEDGVSGVLTAVEDADALAAGIRQLLDDPAAATAMAGAGARAYQADFSNAVIMGRYAELFRQRAAEHPR